jgi:hypothetical protein
MSAARKAFWAFEKFPCASVIAVIGCDTAGGRNVPVSNLSFANLVMANPP